jgi:hypothetical protein
MKALLNCVIDDDKTLLCCNSVCDNLTQCILVLLVGLRQRMHPQLPVLILRIDAVMLTAAVCRGKYSGLLGALGYAAHPLVINGLAQGREDQLLAHEDAQHAL